MFTFIHHTESWLCILIAKMYLAFQIFTVMLFISLHNASHRYEFKFDSFPGSLSILCKTKKRAKNTTYSNMPTEIHVLI